MVVVDSLVLTETFFQMLAASLKACRLVVASLAPMGAVLEPCWAVSWCL